MKSKKKLTFLLLAIIPLLLISAVTNENVIVQQVALNANNINAWFLNTGVFDQDKRTTNTPGFEWPKGSGKFAVFTAGFSCAGYIQNNLRQFMCSYSGELAPGYIIDSSGIPLAKTNSQFKIYSVKKTDNPSTPDWANWGQMVPFGAPYIDVNNNGNYEPAIDSPGVRKASQTLFVCLTDGFPEEHKLGEGFGGGTLPMFAEVRLTAWAYDINGLKDIQFMKWQVINKNHYSWDSTFFGLVSDPDLGNADDDYIGSDTIKKMGFCYNADNNDEQGSTNYNYGLNPPAVGFKFIKTPKNYSGQQLGLTSCVYFTNLSTPPNVACETDPNGEHVSAYNMLQGLKKDKTPWVIPPGGNPSLITKYVYTGNPESGLGWNEGYPGTITGRIRNCGGPNVLTGPRDSINAPGDRRLVMGTGSKTLKVNPGDTQIIVAAQLIARGTSNLNSVTLLKQLSDVAETFYVTGNIIGVQNVSSEVPQQFVLYQNYPNPFNPVTKIKFSLPANVKRETANVKLYIYDILGQEAAILVNENLQDGTYEAEWDAVNYPSGVYFYRLIVNGIPVDTKKMLLIK